MAIKDRLGGKSDSHTMEEGRIGSIFVKGCVQISLKFLNEHVYTLTGNSTAENLN